ncbi:MAG TPA: metalloregulator ArsR/SmtB family transcription factor [Ktedonobacteraceae bacterium]|nr:metalloregulator ArsR/SmtB family transcription factor [Ktedonobacteraceae bacterium]
MEQVQLLAKIAAALSDPIRLQILSILVKGRDASCVSFPHPQFPQAVCPYLDVQPKLGNIATSKLSYHLKELREAGLIEEHRLGKQVFYLVDQKTLVRFLEMVQAYYLTPTDPC